MPAASRRIVTEEATTRAPSAHAGARLEPCTRSLRPERKRAIDLPPRLERQRVTPVAVDPLGQQGVGLRVADLALDPRRDQEPPRLGMEGTVAGRVGPARAALRREDVEHRVRG